MRKDTGVLPGQRILSGPEHDMTVGNLTLADDRRPEAMLLIVWSWYALQHQIRILYQLMCRVPHWHSIFWIADYTYDASQMACRVRYYFGISITDQDRQMLQLLKQTDCGMSKIKFLLTQCLT